MTAVAVCLAGLLCGALGYAIGRRDWQAQNQELGKRLQELQRLVRQSRLVGVDPATRARLRLITSNVRHGVQRGK